MPDSARYDVVVVGAGPAGLFAAERLAAAGHRVAVFERMPSPARKFLLAGRGGLNLTHSEPPERFVTRYGDEAPRFSEWVGRFTPSDLREWAAGLGVETFVGTSGRVFPVGLKASTLARAWLRRLDGYGVRLFTRHRWTGFTPDGAPVFVDGEGREKAVPCRAVLLALGGASWPRTGSDGGWVDILTGLGVEVATLVPANAGYRVDWPADFSERFQGAPVKPAALSFGERRVRGEFVVTRDGIEGGAVYALGPDPRRAILETGSATLFLDLKPEQTMADLIDRLTKPRGRRSVGKFVREALGLSDVGYGLLVALSPREVMDDPAALARAVKALPLTLSGLTPIERAISSAGGVRFSAVDDHLMLKALPGVFVAGEMLDWEAPTGGYLLQGCFASGAHVADGLMEYLD